MIYRYNDFDNQLNEGVFDFFKNMFNKLQNYAKKIKESKKIDAIIDESKKEIDNLFEEKIKDLIDEEIKKNGGTVEKEEAKVESLISSFKRYNKIYEADEKKDEIVDDKKEKIENPIDKAISEWKDLVKEKLKIYLQSDNKDVKLYTQGKLSELNQHILTKKIKEYKANKSLSGLLKKSEEESKANAERAKKIQEQLAENLGDKEPSTDKVKGTKNIETFNKMVKKMKNVSKKQLLKIRDELGLKKQDNLL